MHKSVNGSANSLQKADMKSLTKSKQKCRLILSADSVTIPKPRRQFTMSRKVYLDYIAKTGDTTKTIIASTASPYKFSASVLEAIEGEKSDKDEYEQVAHLAEVSGIPVPQSLADLKDKAVRFSEVINKETMEAYVLKQLGISE